MNATRIEERTDRRRSMTIARKAVKVASLPLGILRGRRARDVVILGYHRVGPGTAEIDMPISAFTRQMDLLASLGEVRSLDDAIEHGGAVVLTFDDGTRDFSEEVLPVLVERKLPALLYLATAMTEEPPSLGLGPGLSWSMLRDALATGLVAVGSHTHRHVDLAHASASEAESEMRRSKELIEDRLGTPCRHFAYPWGVGSRAADEITRRLFETAAIDAWRTNRWGAIDPHRLGRTPVLRSDGTAFFRMKVRGWLDLERVAYRAMGRGPWAKA
ncbi:MAG TPA: polysaccharide deacetylase family protein [Actinomycetota bacterium]|nr:polysaccharide deacetylase family protein [Actinomycetota bacterium]